MEFFFKGLVTLWCSVVKCRRMREAEKYKRSASTSSYTFSAVDGGQYPHLTVSQPESAADGMICRSVSIPLPRDCAIVRRLRAETYAGFSNWLITSNWLEAKEK